jgi:hypothetical protein
MTNNMFIGFLIVEGLLVIGILIAFITQAYGTGMILSIILFMVCVLYGIQKLVDWVKQKVNEVK